MKKVIIKDLETGAVEEMSVSEDTYVVYHCLFHLKKMVEALKDTIEGIKK